MAELDRSSLPAAPAAGHPLPVLRLVAPAAVALHEDADPARVDRLVQRLQRDGVLRNPPVAAALADGYVVLDGANRVSALAALGSPVVPLQVVDYADPAIRLEVWRHLIVEAVDIPQAVQAAGLTIEPLSRDAAARALESRTIACYIATPGGTLAVRHAPSRRLGTTLALVVGTYKSAARIYRVSGEDLDALAREYGGVGAVVVFPRLGKEDIVEIAGSPVKLPTGITRHLIPGRVLRLNLPLAALTAPGDVEEKNRWLHDLIHQRLHDHAVRHYPEGVFLFDE